MTHAGRSQRVVLVRHTLDPEALTALGARLCYAGGDVDKLLKTIEEKDQRAFVERVMAMGQRACWSMRASPSSWRGVSRVLLAQLTRHRIASFSVQSQRYVSYAGGFGGYIVPPGHPRAGVLMRRRSTMPRWRRCRHGTRGWQAPGRCGKKEQ